MDNSRRPITPFSLQLNQPTTQHDTAAINNEGLFFIQSEANARRLNHEENRSPTKNNEINDISWICPNPTPVKASSNPTATSMPKTNIDFQNNFFRRNQPIATTENVTRFTPPLVNPIESTYHFDCGNTERPITAKSRSHTDYYKIYRDKSYAKFFQRDTFCDNFRLAIIEKFQIEVQINNSIEENVAYTIVFSGSYSQVLLARDTLEILLTTAMQKKVLNKSVGFWVCNPQATGFIQEYANKKNVNCLCETSEQFGLIIYYFPETITTLKYISTTEAAINDIIHKFRSDTITIPEDVDIIVINEYFQKLQECCIHMSNKDPLIIIQQGNILLLFGAVYLVKRIVAQHEKMKSTVIATQIELDFKDYEIEFLLSICQNELKQFEIQNPDVQIVSGIKNRIITGPKKTLDAVKQKLEEIVKVIRQKPFIIDNIGFSSLIIIEEKRLLEISSTNKCLLKTELQSIEKIYSAPISTASKDINSHTSSAMSIDIRIGDLAEQSVDMVVVCSTSINLMKDILNKAGTAITEEVNKAFKNENIRQNGYITSGGQLLCQKLLFLPWTTQKLNDEDLRQSIHIFFRAAVLRALDAQQTSIAFPALGCGELKFDPKLIAEIILGETQKYANYNLKILIMLLPNKIEAYEAFCLKLAELRQSKPATNPLTFHYTHTIVKGILTGSEDDTEKCLKLIENHVSGCVQTSECDEFKLNTWNQTAINMFFENCFAQHVIPEVNLKTEKLKLIGPKDKVLEIKAEFYRIQSIRTEEALAATYARLAVWVHEVNDGVIEQYSLKLNAIIEKAFTDNENIVSFKNGQKEDCVIYFKDNIEICGERKRRVIRKDLRMPSHWIPQSEDVIRHLLNVNDDEYIKVLNLFNQTMAGKYTWIQIERIQNQRWYTAYKTLKHYSKQKETEQLLFHGCPETSADMIIHSCFNRSFAGVNGVAYGVGVYFSKKASYSHRYAKESPATHRRCMFLVKVLVGKSTLGNSGMRIPPAGYDSTTDNNHIFVTYHDDQAYAEYLITYT